MTLAFAANVCCRASCFDRAVLKMLRVREFKLAKSVLFHAVAARKGKRFAQTWVRDRCCTRCTPPPLVEVAVSCRPTSDAWQLTRLCKNLYTAVMSLRCLLFSSVSTDKHSESDIIRQLLQPTNSSREIPLNAFKSGYVTLKIWVPVWWALW